MAWASSPLSLTDVVLGHKSISLSTFEVGRVSCSVGPCPKQTGHGVLTPCTDPNRVSSAKDLVECHSQGTRSDPRCEAKRSLHVRQPVEICTQWSVKHRVSQDLLSNFDHDCCSLGTVLFTWIALRHCASDGTSHCSAWPARTVPSPLGFRQWRVCCQVMPSDRAGGSTGMPPDMEKNTNTGC